MRPYGHLRCWGPEDRAGGFQGPSYGRPGTDTQHCFPCKTLDMDDKFLPPWQSPQTVAYTSHSAYPGIRGSRNQMHKNSCGKETSIYSLWMYMSISTYNGVIVALETNIWLVNTSTVAVFVAAALRGAVFPHKAKVTPANSRGHARPIHTALCTHRLTLTRNTEQKKKKR